jgi:LysR family glycine cleavage system transcriptional activator
LDEGFGVIGGALDLIGQDSAQRPLTITTVPSFAERWLVPRLKGFWQTHPDIAIALRPDYKVVDMRRERIDIAIRYGRGTWPDVEATFLVSARLVVVGAPALVGDGKNLSPEDLSRLPWVDEGVTKELIDWLQAHGITPPARLAAVLPNDDLAMAAAREGVGLYLASAPLAANDVRRGDLLVVFDPQDESPGFYMVTLPGPLRPAARTFIKWLKSAV